MTFFVTVSSLNPHVHCSVANNHSLCIYLFNLLGPVLRHRVLYVLVCQEFYSHNGPESVLFFFSKCVLFLYTSLAYFLYSFHHLNWCCIMLLYMFLKDIFGLAFLDPASCFLCINIIFTFCCSNNFICLISIP
jgi:hypothetical protein